MATYKEAVAQFVAQQTAFNARQGAAIDKAVASADGVTGDVTALKDKILELENSAGEVTPEDAALIAELVTMSEAVTAKSEALSVALAALDEATPPVVPPPPPNP